MVPESIQKSRVDGSSNMNMPKTQVYPTGLTYTKTISSQCHVGLVHTRKYHSIRLTLRSISTLWFLWTGTMNGVRGRNFVMENLKNLLLAFPTLWCMMQNSPILMPEFFWSSPHPIQAYFQTRRMNSRKSHLIRHQILPGMERKKLKSSKITTWICIFPSSKIEPKGRTIGKLVHACSVQEQGSRRTLQLLLFGSQSWSTRPHTKPLSTCKGITCGNT